MPDSKHGKRYLILLSISPSTPERLRVIVPSLKAVLERISTEVIEQLFRSVGADHFGYLIRSKLVAQQILSIIETPQREDIGLTGTLTPPFLTRQDSVFVMELGQDHAAQLGFSRATTWLQRH